MPAELGSRFVNSLSFSIRAIPQTCPKPCPHNSLKDGVCDVAGPMFISCKRRLITIFMETTNDFTPWPDPFHRGE
jgi:hypothetical protein